MSKCPQQDHHLAREAVERLAAASSVDKATRNIHFALADLHADRALILSRLMTGPDMDMHVPERVEARPSTTFDPAALLRRSDAKKIFRRLRQEAVTEKLRRTTALDSRSIFRVRGTDFSPA